MHVDDNVKAANSSPGKRRRTEMLTQDEILRSDVQHNPFIQSGSSEHASVLFTQARTDVPNGSEDGDAQLHIIVAAESESPLWSEKDVDLARALILDRISDRVVSEELVGLDEQFNKIYDLLNRTVSDGESNSCLIIGNHGTGKTAIIRRAIKLLEDEFVRITSKPARENFVVVYLNGLAQTDDRTALKEITRQLRLEQELDGKGFASFAESFTYLLSLLKVGSRDTVPIVFILEEFDLFAQHPKQALLYNLFDVAQSSQNPVAVLGTTCRLDAMDLLEKRVKSRFSHRQIYLFPPEQFKDFERVAKGTLLLTDQIVRNAVYRNRFNEHVEALFEDKSFLMALRRIFDLTKDLRGFFKICFEPTVNLSLGSSFLLAKDFYDSALLQRADAKTELLKGTSLLELCLIIAMKKLLERDATSFNFEMVYDEYKEFMDRTALQGGVGMKLYKKPVAFKAFEHLLSFELIRPVESVARCPKEYRMMKVMLEPLQITEAVLKFRDCPMLVRKWGASAVA